MRYTNEYENDNDSIDIYSTVKQKKHKPKRKKKTIKIITIICFVLSVLLIVGGGLYLYAYAIVDNIKRVPLDTTDPAELYITTNEYESVKNIALLGIDSRSDNDSGRSDAIIVLTIDQENDKIKLTSIARDTCVEIDGHGKEKLTHAYAYGKHTLAVKTLNKNLGLEISDYVTVNFFGFTRVIDYIGGVEIDVNSKEMNHLNSYVIPKLRKETSLKCDYIKGTGKQHLSGAQALCYSRIRKIDSDVERGNRQKEVLAAMFNKVKGSSVTDLPEIAEMVLKQCQTSLSTDDIMDMGFWAITSGPTIENMSIPNDNIKAEGRNENGSWMFFYDLDKASAEIKKFILEK